MGTRLDKALNGQEACARALTVTDGQDVPMAAEDYEAGLVDCLVNLMHFAERYDIDFDVQLSRARFHYDVETTYDWDEEPGLDRKEEDAG